MAAAISVKLVISSEIRLIDLVHAASEKMAEVVGFDDDEALNVGLAVREAVINAILHGNRRDPDLKVGITLTIDQGELRAKVTDEGNGFDHQRTPDPTKGVNLMSDSGRGLLLMQAFVDRIEFKNGPGGGTEVTMIKRLPSEGGNAEE